MVVAVMTCPAGYRWKDCCRNPDAKAARCLARESEKPVVADNFEPIPSDERRDA